MSEEQAILYATSTAPYLCAQAMDDTTIVDAHEAAVHYVRWACQSGLLRSSDPSLIPPLGVAGRASEEARAMAAWARLLLLAIGMEIEYRTGRRPETAEILDRVPRPVGNDWPVPDRPFGMEPRRHRADLMVRWRAMAEADEMPQWTRRGPPAFLFELLWSPWP
jgi:hypothetical protein